MINVTNHPSSRWSEYQRREAKAWGWDVLTDIPFPVVPPTATTEEVQQLAMGLAAAIVTNGDTAVHLMGESGLVFTTLSLLREKADYIVCIHSTTDRKVVEKVEENGTVTKTAVFEFVQFRAYW